VAEIINHKTENVKPRSKSEKWCEELKRKQAASSLKHIGWFNEWQALRNSCRHHP
jgi:hypothetical protein